MGRIERKLDEIVEEIKAGRREPTLLSLGDDENLAESERQWDILKSELLDEGLTKPDVEAHKLTIRAKLQAVAETSEIHSNVEAHPTNLMTDNERLKRKLERSCTQNEISRAVSTPIVKSIPQPGVIDATEAQRRRRNNKTAISETKSKGQGLKYDIAQVYEHANDASFLPRDDCLPSLGRLSSPSECHSRSSLSIKRRRLQGQPFLGDAAFNSPVEEPNALGLAASVGEKSLFQADRSEHREHLYNSCAARSEDNISAPRSQSDRSLLLTKGSDPPLLPPVTLQEQSSLNRNTSEIAEYHFEESTEYNDQGGIKKHTVIRRGSTPGTAQRSPANSSPIAFGQSASPPFFARPPPQMENRNGSHSQDPIFPGPLTPTAAAPVADYQIMTLDTENGPINVPVDVQAASRVAESNRKRNATASFRFRQRRMEKERETSQMIANLKRKIKEISDQKSQLSARVASAIDRGDFYRAERDCYRDILANHNITTSLPPRPSTPVWQCFNDRVMKSPVPVFPAKLPSWIQQSSD